MGIIWRITLIAWGHRVRLLLAYVTIIIGVALSLLIPKIVGVAIDKVVEFDATAEAGNMVSIVGTETSFLVYLALALLAASVLRGLFDFGRTYATDSLSQKVAYDVRNMMYDKLQHLSFAFHDKEHTGNLMSKVTSDIEAIRRYVNIGMVRGVEVPVRVLAIVVLLVSLNWPSCCGDPPR